MKINTPVINPNNFETAAHGYWMVLNSKGDSIGVILGRVETTRLDSVNMAIDLDPISGDFTVSLPKRSYTLKAITKIEFETAQAFGLGPEYDDQELPKLVPK